MKGKYYYVVRLKNFNYFIKNVQKICYYHFGINFIINNIHTEYDNIGNVIVKYYIIPKLSLTNDQKENLIQLFNTNPELFVKLMNSYLKEEKNKLKLKEQNEKRTKSSISN